MFSKADKTKERTRVRIDSAPSIISANLHVVGDLNTDGEIQVDGSVNGDVSVRALTIGANAVINGEVEAENVIVRGTVNGRIKAQTVELAKSAKVNGDIWHESLAVEAGAFLDGHCKRIGESASSTEADQPAPEVQEEVTPENVEDISAARPVTAGN